MCTASWSVGQGRLSLCFNRDERKSRGEAYPPRVLEDGLSRLVAAIDPDAGGTWLALNETGLCVFLLNNYAAEALLAAAPSQPRSRGELPLRYASSANRSAAVARLEGDPLEPYRPFVLVLADTDGVDAFAWNGATLGPLPDVGTFLTTSSYRTDEVESYRKRRYEELLSGRASLDPEERREMHIGTPHPDPAFNAMMLRAESRTRSVSTVSVGERAVTYRYEVVLGETRRLGGAATVSVPRGGAKGEGL